MCKSMEIVNSVDASVSCCGKEPPYDHPKVYLEIDKAKKEVSCPYCSKKFRLIETK
ncbi:MAG TPA: zinc-finger domain-containing protein [Rickettsia endosymbiont of Degeeriella rufa]|nr:zinc-finger domain-containing protein [Rickettsia endosymbiont of Degeeriella rufa]